MLDLKETRRLQRRVLRNLESNMMPVPSMRSDGMKHIATANHRSCNSYYDSNSGNKNNRLELSY